MRVRPILTLGVMAGALALPGAAYALGLGKLTVQSSIGQPLAAQIALTSAAREELDTLTVRIADPSLYKQNNLSYNGVLSRARITVERGAAGDPYLRIVTQGAVNEPYLDLMVEVNWASGRLVREYTFLLDPPGILAAPVEPVAPVRIGAAPPRPAATPAPAAAPATPGATGSATASPPPAPRPAAPAPRAAAPAAAPGDEYAVKRGDNLSKIATDYKPPNATLEQMMVALFNANQRAFDGGNMNRLRAGSIVTIPSADSAAATAPAEAAKVVRMQASDWRSYRDRVASTAPSSDAGGTRTSGGKIGTNVVDAVPAVPPGRDQLKVSRDAGLGKSGAGAAGGGTSDEAVARDRQIKEAQQRIAELEKTLTELQKAVALKNQSMAQLQAQADAAKGAPAKAAEPAKAPEPKVAEAPKAAAPQPEPAKAMEPPKAAEAPKATETPKAAQPSMEPAKAPDAAKPADAKAPDAPKSAPAAPQPAAKSEPSFLGDLMGGTPTWAIGGGALVVLAGIAAMLAARRRKSPKYEDGIIADTDIKTNTVFGSTGGGVVNTGDNSLSSEFSREGLGSIDTDEVDPIAEAEVYLAYGRDAQAEEILRHALRKDPQRQEVYLKLLEIHAQHNKPSAFENVAAELYSVSQGKGETWQKAIALGRQLDPNNPMFAEGHGSDAADAAAGAAATGGDPESFSVMPDLRPDAPRSGDGARRADAGAGSENAFDLRLDEDLSIMPRMEPAPKSPGDILAGAESELEKTARIAAAGAAAKSAFDAPPAARSAPAEPPKPAGGLDFRLDPFDTPAPAEPKPRAQPANDLDKLDLSFDRAQPPADDPTPSILDGQWHDAATKLDLAKAYQEMGDVEGAREILQEVLREGDEKQKTEAQGLIAKLA